MVSVFSKVQIGQPLNNMKLNLFLFLFSITALTVSAQKRALIIPFTLTSQNNISVQAVLNDKDTVSLMLHTAASSVTLIENSISKLKSIKFNGEDTVKSWGGESAARFSFNNSLQVGGMKFNNVSIWENKNSGAETDGKFGLDLFKDHVLKIDFDKKVLTISSALPKDINKYEKHKIVLENDLMFLEADCTTGGTVLKNRFLIHSGYSGTVLFDDQFVSENKLDQTLKMTGEKKLTDSYGNTIKTIQAILPTLKIGSLQLDNVTVGFFSGSLGIQKISVLGMGVLKQFNVIIDAKREYIYLKPCNRNV